jgi:hypothetical protein
LPLARGLAAPDHQQAPGIVHQHRAGRRNWCQVMPIPTNWAIPAARPHLKQGLMAAGRAVPVGGGQGHGHGHGCGQELSLASLSACMYHKSCF